MCAEGRTIWLNPPIKTESIVKHGIHGIADCLPEILFLQEREGFIWGEHS